jgi:hypothetical protein
MISQTIQKLLLTLITVSLIVATIGYSGKSGISLKQPVVYKAEFHPKYICKDEPIITFTWSEKYFQRLEIHKANGGPLLVLQSDQGSVTTPPITPDMLPLRAKAVAGKKSLPVPLLLHNVDQYLWTMPYPSDTENGGQLEAEFSRVEQNINEDGTYTTIQVYDLFQEFTDFTWQIPGDDFSQKVRLTKIHNSNDYPLIVSGHGIRETTIDPNEVFTVKKVVSPAGQWTLKF